MKVNIVEKTTESLIFYYSDGVAAYFRLKDDYDIRGLTIVNNNGVLCSLTFSPGTENSFFTQLNCSQKLVASYLSVASSACARPNLNYGIISRNLKNRHLELHHALCNEAINCKVGSTR